MTATFTTTPPGSEPARNAAGAADGQIASLARRSIALLLDLCLLTALWIGALAVVWVVAGTDPDYWDAAFAYSSDNPTTAEILRSAGRYLLFTVIWVLYAGVFTTRSDGWNGQTPGKRAAQLRIVSAGGEPLVARVAWKRALVMGVVLGAPDGVGPLIDLAFGDAIASSTLVGYLGVAVLALAATFTLRGNLRQSLFDRLANTVVVDVPVGTVTIPAAPAAPADPAAADAPITFTQSTVDGAAPRTIVPRRRTAKTWIAVFTPILLYLGLVVVAAGFDFPEDRSKEILALPDTKDELARARALESLVVACIKTRKSAESCQYPEDLGDTGDLVFADGFDVYTDPIGKHAGKVGIYADGDDKAFVYAFTKVDRIWVSTIDGSSIVRECYKVTADELCDGISRW